MATWQASFRGLTIGASTNYELTGVQGLTDLPGVRTADVVRSRRHGVVGGDDFSEGRSIVLSLDINQDTSNDIGDLVDAFIDAFTQDAEGAFVFTFPGVAGGAEARVMARCRKRSVPITLPYTYGVAEAVVELFATDPRVYTNAESTDSVNLEAAGGGVSFPITFPFTWGSSSTGSIQATNSGNFDAPVVFTITGPITNPIILNNTTGEKLAFSTTVADGDTLVVDTNARTVMLNGTASRYSTLSTDSTWFDFPPGTTEVKLQGSTAGSPTLEAAWRSAWL